MRPEKVAAARQPERVVATRPGYGRARGLLLTRVQRRPRSLPQMVRTTPGGAEGPGGRYQFIQLRGKGSGHGAMDIGTD